MQGKKCKEKYVIKIKFNEEMKAICCFRNLIWMRITNTNKNYKGQKINNDIFSPSFLSGLTTLDTDVKKELNYTINRRC